MEGQEESKPKKYVIVKVKVPGIDEMVKAYVGTDEGWHRIGGAPIESVERWEEFNGRRG